MLFRLAQQFQEVTLSFTGGEDHTAPLHHGGYIGSQAVERDSQTLSQHQSRPPPPGRHQSFRRNAHNGREARGRSDQNGLPADGNPYSLQRLQRLQIASWRFQAGGEVSKT